MILVKTNLLGGILIIEHDFSETSRVTWARSVSLNSFSVNCVQEPLNTSNSSLLPLSCHVVDEPQKYLGIFPFDIDGISN